MNKETTELMFSSKSDEWSTPNSFYQKLNKQFNFTLDPCATEENHKCEKYHTIEIDGLKQDWRNESVFVNPPYSKIYDWTKKCFEEGQKYGTCVVLLIPARTDTKYFHEFVMKATEVRFVKGRLKFGNEKNSAPFPSMIVVFDGMATKTESPRIITMEK